MSKRPPSAVLVLLLGAGCVPDPGIKVPDFSVPNTSTDMAPAADLASAGDMTAAATWTASKAGTANLRGVWVSDANLGTIYAVGHDGTILRKVGAADFAPEPSGTTENLYAVLGVTADDVYAVGAKGTILHRVAGTWTKEGAALNLTMSLYGLAAPAAGEIYAVGDGGLIVKKTGMNWATEASGTSKNLRAVAGLSAGEVFAAGAEGTVLRRSMGAWAADTATIATADKQNLWALAFLDTALYAAGDFGVVLKRAADKWSAEATVKPAPMMGQPPNFLGLWAGGGEVVAVGSGGAIQRRAAAGTWTEEKSGQAEDLSSIAGGGPRALIAVGNKGAVVRR